MYWSGGPGSAGVAGAKPPGVAVLLFFYSSEKPPSFFITLCFEFYLPFPGFTYIMYSFGCRVMWIFMTVFHQYHHPDSATEVKGSTCLMFLEMFNKMKTLN